MLWRCGGRHGELFPLLMLCCRVPSPHCRLTRNLLEAPAQVHAGGTTHSPDTILPVRRRYAAAFLSYSRDPLRPSLCLLASAYDNITALISLSSSWSYPYGVGGHTQHEHKPGERDYARNNACAPPGPKQSQMACRCGSTAIGCSGATWRWSLGREERVAGFALVQTYSRLLQSTLERVLGATPEHSAAPATLETPLHSGDKVFLPDVSTEDSTSDEQSIRCTFVLPKVYVSPGAQVRHPGSENGRHQRHLSQIIRRKYSRGSLLILQLTDNKY
ncbi:uncharacterized protein BXZ73DRAFT_74616 [Epithele typhae]|uniref:uncharacterized protein n=1 Tax=Epithele typhae TaxID=378194 RepID=UPI0020081145|nr:uncharacterized protein BXZ73DRAFT_74616 [Epithele typhae]KAH9942340.1 hypothetical protein BXZ73DRAFT_74616 [Epithele typhae]